MKKVLTALANLNLETIMRHMPWYIFAVAAFIFIFPVLLHILTFRVTEADGAGIAGMIWVVIAAAYWVYARRVETLHNQNIMAIESLQNELRALDNIYQGTLETLAHLDKDILKRHGIHISLQKKRVVN